MVSLAGKKRKSLVSPFLRWKKKSDVFYYNRKLNLKFKMVKNRFNLRLTFFMVTINTNPSGGGWGGGYCTSCTIYSFQATPYV